MQANTIPSILQSAVLQAAERLELSATATLSIEQPADPQHGDFASTAALALFGSLTQEQKAQFSNPRQLAEAVRAELKFILAAEDWLADISIAGPGFINFSLADGFLIRKMRLAAQGKLSEQLQQETAKTAVVEYSSPNIAKPFTIGHLRSTIIGDAVANLLMATGVRVIRDNHLGDWGTQFGKQIYAIKHLGEGSEEANIAKISASENPVQELVKLYVEFHSRAEKEPELEERGREWFVKLEQGDPEARRLWQQCIDWSFVEFERIYKRLGVQFDANNGRGFGESFFEDKMAPVIEELAACGLLQESKGAQLVFFPKDALPPLMLLKQDGSTLYATRDLATDRYRLQTYGRDVQIINEVGAEQSLYFQQIFEVEHMLGWTKPGQRVHVQHGLYRFKDRKMSTRKGNVIWLEDVLNEAVARARSVAAGRQLPPEISEKVGIGALKWNDLKRSAHLNVAFDWDEILNMQGNSGPYLQYTYVRTQSVLSTLKSITGIPIDTLINSNTQSSYRPITDEKSILRHIANYSDVVRFAAQEYAPHHLCTYLYELSRLFNSFYATHQILEKEGKELSKTAAFRAELTAAVGSILAHGLGILGIETVDQM